MPSTFSIAFPPAPTFTESSLPSLVGKVYIVTGAASGVGFELAKIIYNAGGTVYIAARSTSRCDGAIEKIKAQGKRQNNGKLGSIVIDLADLRTVKGAVESFLKKESRLDVLFHNAGVMTPPKGSKDKLGHDLEMGTNCLGPYLFTVLLEPLLVKTAALCPQYGVRLVWVSSMMQVSTPPGAMSFDEHGAPNILKNPTENYMHSKVGACWLAAEFSTRLGSKGILSVSVHPGLMKTELQRNFAPGLATIMGIVFKPPIYGAYSELFCGFSPDMKAENNGGFMTAWGRVAEMPKDIAKGMPDKAGGPGKRFIEYCDRETVGYM